MIKGELVGLRAVEGMDLPVLLEWRNNPENRKYFREWRELNFQHQLKWFQEHVMGDASPIMFAIQSLKEGSLLGCCGLTYIDWVHRSSEISIYIGSGYLDDVAAPEALDLMVNYALSELGLHRLYIRVYDYDEKRKDLARNGGFLFEGRLKDAHFCNGAFHDECIYGLVAGRCDA
jgi:RimJ/RimL family protein N-acetyltransferase